MKRFWLAGVLLVVGCGSSGSAATSASPPGTGAGGAVGAGGASSMGAGGDAADAGADAADSGPTVRPGKDGDLGGGNPIVDHSAPSGGLLAGLTSGAITGTTWSAPGCGDVPLATGVVDPRWSEETYDDAAPAPRDVHTSFRFDTATSLSVMWAAAPGNLASWVAMGDSPDKLDRFVEGISFAYANSPGANQAMPLRVHEAHVCGLQPSRTYYFAVGGDGYYGRVYAVKTGPEKSSASSFRLGVIGDSNNIFYDQFAIVTKQLRAAAPDVALFTGDLVHDGTVQTQWDEWFTASGDMFAGVPLMTAHGNHEMMATAYFAQFAMPGNEEYYSFDYGQAHFVVLNDSPSDDSEFPVEAAFLDQDLTAAQARPVPPTFLVAVHHRPPFCSPESNLNVRASFTPVYDAHHVDLVLNGHAHVYESTLPLKNGMPVASPKDGTIYVTTGGAGSIITDPAGQEAFSRTYARVYNYVIIDVAGTTLSLTPFGADGVPLEDPIVIAK